MEQNELNEWHKFQNRLLTSLSIAAMMSNHISLGNWKP